MEKESILGKMAENMKGSITTIKSMDMENIIGLMVDVFKANGLTAKEQETERLQTKKDKLNKEFGIKIKE